MIRRVADSAQFSYCCELLGKEFVYSIRIIAGGKCLLTSRVSVPQSVDAIRSLIQGYWADAVVATEAQTKGRSLFENIGSYVMGNFAAMEDRWRRQKVFDDESLETRRSADLRIVLVTKAIEKEKESVPIASPLIVSCDSRYYALHQNGLLFRERLKARSSNDLPNPCECQRHWRDYAEAANAYVKIVRRRHMASIQQNSAALKVLAPLETEAAKAATGKAVLTS